MPQWRKLHTKSLDSLDINDMPDDFCRVLWLMLPLALDRRGRGLDNAAWVRSKAMPLREDVTNEMAQAAMDWLAEHGMIARYEVDGRRYFWVPTWHQYQGDTRREAESLLPAPPGYADPYAEKEETPNDYTQEQGESESGTSQELVTSESGQGIALDSDSDTDSKADSEEKPPTAGVKPPKPPTEAQKMFSALAELCQVDWKACTDKQRGALNQSEGKLRKAGAVPDDMPRFADWWYEHDWRGKKGDVPRPSQVREEWGKFIVWRNSGGRRKYATVEIAQGLGPPS